MTTEYVQVRLSRTDGRSWDRVFSGYGARAVAHARKEAAALTNSAATDYVEVITEDRAGACTSNQRRHLWSRANGWRLT